MSALIVIVRSAAHWGVLWNIFNLLKINANNYVTEPNVLRTITALLACKVVVVEGSHLSCYSFYVGGQCLIKPTNRLGVKNDPL